MNSEEYLKNVTLGEPSIHNQKIELEEYDINWPILFQTEAKKILAALEDKALQIEHVGSTSVPELCAKPIIDILLLVKDAADEESYTKALESAGYILRIREPEWFEHRMFKRNMPTVNLHVFSQDCEEAKRMLAFREWLRENKEDCDLYANTKRQLAKQVWKYVQDYADAKTQIVQNIMERAIKHYFKTQQ